MTHTSNGYVQARTLLLAAIMIAGIVGGSALLAGPAAAQSGSSSSGLQADSTSINAEFIGVVADSGTIIVTADGFDTSGEDVTITIGGEVVTTATIQSDGTIEKEIDPTQLEAAPANDVEVGFAEANVSNAATVTLAHEVIGLDKGFNLVSVPQPASLLSEDVDSINQWIPSDNTYVTVDDPSAKSGFDLHSGWYVTAGSDDARWGYDYETGSVPSPDSITLENGWHLLGSNFNTSTARAQSVDADLGNIDVSYGGVLAYRQDFDQINNGGESISEYEPYWVFIDNPDPDRRLRPVANYIYDRDARETTLLQVENTATGDTFTGNNAIQDAVDNANPDNTLRVGPGTYEESVTLDKEGLTLEAADGASPTIDGQSSVAVSIESPSVTLSDFTIQNPGGDRGVRATDDATSVEIVRNTIENVGTAGAFNQSRGILVSSLNNGDSANGLEIRNNTVDTVRGTGGNDDQTIGIQILEESNGGGLIENIVVDNNAITDLLDNRSSQGINFNGNIEGDITNNSISTLNTDRPGADLGFTQAIVLNAGGNADSPPQNVNISGNSISNLDDQTPSSESFRATHVILSAVDGVSTINITNNEFTAVASDENYILDRASGDFDLQGTLGANTFSPNTVQVTDGSDRVLVPETGVNVVNVDQRTGFDDVQPAVDAANSDNTLRVGPGTYEESVTLDKEGLTLEGAGADSTTVVGDGVNTGSQPHAAIHVNDGSNPVRNVTIEDLTVENPNGKFGIFAGTGSTNKDPDGIGGLVIQDNVVQDVSTDSSGSALTGGPAGIGIRGDYGTDGNPGIEINNNEIDNVENLDGGPEPTGITLKSFTGDAGFGFDSSGTGVTDQSSPPATDTDIRNNEISNISSNGGFATKGISVSGEFKDVDIINNQIETIESPGGDARAITLSENSGSYSGNQYDIDGDGNGERIGPQDFNVSENTISNVDAADPRSVNIGGYEVLGEHSVTQNTINSGAVTRFAGDQPGFQPGDGDALNASDNTFTDENAELYYSDGSDAADLDAVSNNNDFSQVDVVVGDTAITRPPNDGEVLNVVQQESFTSIQNAVDNASAGDTIAVGSGTFDESVDISTEGLTLEAAEGAEPTIDIGADTRTNIPANDVTVDGFSVVFEGQAVYVRGDNVAIQNNVFELPDGATSQGYAVRYEGLTSNGEVRDNTFTGITNSADGEFGNGVIISGADGHEIVANTFDGNSIGVNVGSQQPAGELLVSDNTFTGQDDFAVALNHDDSASPSITVRSNDFNGDQTDVAVFAGGDIGISDNAFTGDSDTVYVDDQAGALTLSDVLNNEGNTFDPTGNVSSGQIVPE